MVRKPSPSQVVVAAVIAAVATIVAAVITNRVKTEPKAKGHAEISDVIVDDYRKSFDAQVDFRVTNRGELPVSISRVRFAVLSVEETATLGMLPFSANYDLDISSLSKPGQTAEVAVAHEVAQGATERFGVVVTARNMGAGVFRVWRLQPTLVTSGGDAGGRPIEIGLPWNIHKSHASPGSHQ